jgi:hypothetical protein
MVLINPDGPIGLPIDYGDCEILASGGVPGMKFERNAREMTVPLGAYLCLGAPSAPPPDELVAGLRSALSRSSDVERAYLFEGSFGRGSQLTLGIAFRTHPTNERLETVMRNLAPVIKGLGPGRAMDALILQGDLLGSVERQIAPFFEGAG